MGIYTPVAFLFSALTYVVTLPLDVGKEGYKTQLINTACQLEINQTLKAAFQADVRQRYAGTDNLNTLTNRYNMMRVDLPSSVKCYDVCPNSSPSDITWCVHVYHPKENISLCLNNGGIINETYAASVLALEKEFVVKQCAVPSSMCLWTTKTPYYINRAYLVCTSQTSTCVKRSFVDNIVNAAKPGVEITQFPVAPVSATMGESIVLKCSATASSSIVYIQWAKDSSVYYPIHEDPYCSPSLGCVNDTAPDARSARLQRVRHYTIYQPDSLCGEEKMNMISYLLIDNATKLDDGNYTCSAETLLSYPNEKKSASLSLTVT